MRLTDCWRYGYKKVTVDDLAQEVSIGEGTIYLHFHSKEEIVLSHVDRIAERVLELQAIRVLAFIDHDVAKPFPLPLPHICVLARQLHREQQERVEFNCGLGFWVFGGAFTRQDFAVVTAEPVELRRIWPPDDQPRVVARTAPSLGAAARDADQYLTEQPYGFVVEVATGLHAMELSSATFT